MHDELVNFLNPKSVVVVGASRSKRKVGRIIFDQLEKSGRRVFGTNSSLKYKTGNIFPDLCLLKEKIDLAIYAIPADFVINEIEKAAKYGIKNHLIVSAGFGESGIEGKNREKQLLSLVLKYNIRIQGPNCLGNISPINDFNASFGFMPKSGNIGLILQSGAIGTSFLDFANKRNFSISHFISLGNKIDLSENHFLKLLAKDDPTKVIGIYLEEISNPMEFISIARQVTKQKPVVVLRAGKTREAKIAVSSHTGAMAGSTVSEEAAFRQAGIIEAETLEEFFTLLELLSQNFNNLKMQNVLILTNAGGPAVLTVDQFEGIKLPLYNLSESQKRNLDKILIKSSFAKNPLDLLGDATPSLFKKVLKQIPCQNKNLITLIILTPQENTDFKGISSAIIDFKKKYRGILLVNVIGGSKVSDTVSYLRSKNLLVFTFLDEVIKSIDKIRKYDKRKNSFTDSWLETITIDTKSIHILKKLIEKEKGFIQEEKALALAKAYQFPLPPTYFIKSKDHLLQAGKKLDFPLVLKISSSSVIHRNIEGGVFLDIKSEDELLNAYRVLQHKEGNIILQKMVSHDAEIILGAKKDPEFGYLLMFGSGGIHTEYLKDVSFSVKPFFDEFTMHSMIDETKIRALIPNKLTLRGVFASLLSLLSDFPEIDEIDLNPIVMNNFGKPVCVDIKIKI